MKDFRIVQARILLKITSVAPIRGFLPLSIVAVGESLNLAEEVLYNGIQVTDFLISAPNRMIIRVPDSQIGRELTSLEVTTSTPVNRQDSVLSLSLGNRVRGVQGIERLVQSFLMIFMSTPGSDVFEPKSGGGARALIGRNMDGNKGMTADLALAVERTTSELQRSQSRQKSLPPSERLLNSSLDSLEFDRDTTVTSARVTLQNMTGDSAFISVR